MSILTALGASPSNLTVPLTLATVAGSIGVAAGAAAGAAAGCSAVSSFLPHPERRTSPHIAGRPRIFIQVFIFIFCSLLRIRNLKETQNLFAGSAAACASSRRSGRVRGARAAHRSCNAALLFRREPQNVIHKKARVVLIIALERGWRWA